MNSPDFSWIMTIQFVLPFLVLSIVLVLIIMAGRKKFKQAARLLILNVKSNEDIEKQAIISFLTDKLSLDSKMASKKAKKLMNERKFLIRNLVSGLLDKNVEAIGQLNHDLCRVTAHYHGLNLAAAKSEEPVEQQETEEEIDLKAENKSLKQEVHITLTTLNNIFKEFSSMFGEDDSPDGLMTVDQIITAMESFSSKASQASEDNSEEVNTSEAELEPEPEAKPEQNSTKESSADEPLEQSQPEAAEPEPVNESDKEAAEELDFSTDSAIDDIDNALDDLELDASDDDEPDWGDAFAESGDVMDEDDPKK